MAQKPIEQLSPAYRRRIERAMAKGKSRQAARGHRVQEHIIRAQRRLEREENAGLTNAEATEIFAFGEHYYDTVQRANPREELPAGHEMVAWAQAVGYRAFRKYKVQWLDLRKKYVDSGYGPVTTIGAMVMAQAALKLDDISWLYYH